MADLIWDIQVQHLDEVEFLFETCALAMDSPKHTLATLEAGPERRLLAHVDGLRVGGEAVLEGLLLPALAAGEVVDEHERAAAAAFALLESAPGPACARILVALDEACAKGHTRTLAALRSALARTRRRGLAPWLGHGLEGLEPRVLAGRLGVLADLRVDAGARLGPWLRASDPSLRQAAAELARFARAPGQLGALAGWMQDPDTRLRRAALDCALIHGLPGAWPSLVGQLLRGVEADLRRWALGWVGRLGDPSAHAWLLDQLEASPDPASLWAAGLCGRPAAVESALELLEHPTLGRLAGEVVCAIAGAPLEDDGLWLDRGHKPSQDADEALPALERDDLEADLIPREDLALRRPLPDALRSWWAQKRHTFEGGQRYCQGRRLDLQAMREALDRAPMRRRHSLALELAARSRGRAQLHTRALVCVQRGQTQAALAGLDPGLDGLDFQAGLSLNH